MQQHERQLQLVQQEKEVALARKETAQEETKTEAVKALRVTDSEACKAAKAAADAHAVAVAALAGVLGHQATGKAESAAEFSPKVKALKDFKSF